MNTITVRRDELIKRITENRDGHRAIFEAAQEKYRELVIAELDAMLAEAKAGKRIRRGISLVEPQDHTNDYDRVLDMLAMSVDDNIELAERDFAYYVRDEWEWKAQWTATNTSYLVT